MKKDMKSNGHCPLLKDISFHDVRTPRRDLQHGIRFTFLLSLLGQSFTNLLFQKEKSKTEGKKREKYV